MRARGYGPTLAGSGRCAEYIDEPICESDLQCGWRKGYATKNGKAVAAKCVVKGARTVIGKGPGKGHGTEKQKAAAAANPWMEHVRRFRAANPTVSYKDALKLASATYTKK